MNIRSNGSYTDSASSAEALRRVQAASKVSPKLKKRDFGFKLGKLGVYYSTESVEYESAKSATQEAAAGKTSFQRFLPSNDPPRRYFGKYDAAAASDTGTQTSLQNKKVQAYADMAMGLNDPLSRPSHLLAVV